MKSHLEAECHRFRTQLAPSPPPVPIRAVVFCRIWDPYPQYLAHHLSPGQPTFAETPLEPDIFKQSTSIKVIFNILVYHLFGLHGPSFSSLVFKQ